MHFLLSLVLAVQLGSDTLLTRFAGQWSGTGTVLSQPAKISMAWTWELGGHFCDWRFEMKCRRPFLRGTRITGLVATLRLRSGQAAVTGVCGSTTRARSGRLK